MQFRQLGSSHQAARCRGTAAAGGTAYATSAGLANQPAAIGVPFAGIWIGRCRHHSFTSAMLIRSSSRAKILLSYVKKRRRLAVGAVLWETGEFVLTN